VHMSNVMNTPIEVIEGEYPIMIEEQTLRLGSGALGDASAPGCGLGSGPLGRAPPRLVLGSRPLALNRRARSERFS